MKIEPLKIQIKIPASKVKQVVGPLAIQLAILLFKPLDSKHLSPKYSPSTRVTKIFKKG